MNKKIDKTCRKTLITISVLAISLICLIAVFSLMTKRGKTQANRMTKPNIALVNEDMQSTFNQQDYNFGKNFVDLVSNDNRYNWQVVSRSVADRAYKDGSIDAVIYLPQTFSKDLLTLENLNPTKAKVDYKIQQQKDELSEKTLQNKITSCLYTFNQNVVKMYYASVAGNLAEAENQMKQTVSKQTELVMGLANQVQSPFNRSMSNYDAFISGATGLNGLNKANVALQNSFIDSTKNLMGQTGRSFTNQLPQVTNYFDTQKKIADINVDKGNQAIKKQSTQDQIFYFNQFGGLHECMDNQLAILSQKDLSENAIGQIPEFNQSMANYHKLIAGVQGNLSEQITTLTSQRQNLLDLENELYAQFFDKAVSASAEDYESFSDLQITENAKQALANKLKTPLSKTDNFANSPYLDKLAQQISEISLDVADYKLDNLVTNGIIDQGSQQKIEMQLQVIRQYATAFDLNGGTITLENVKKSGAVKQNLTRKMNVTVPAGMTYQSSAFPSNVKISPISKTGIMVSPDNRIQLANPLLDYSKGSTDKGNAKTFSFELRVALDDEQAFSMPTTWTNQTTQESIFQTTDHFAVLPKANETDDEQYAKVNFQNLMTWFSQIDSISGMITTLYAEPSADYTSLLSALTQEDFKNQSQHSVVNMYGNMALDDLKNRLSDQDVNAFKAMGEKNLSKVIVTIKRLNTVIASLQDDEQRLQNNLPEQYFEENLKALASWYDQTMEMIDSLYQNWQIQDPATLEVKEWPQYNSAQMALYTDPSTQLYDQIKALVSTTNQATETITESAQVVKDNSEQFTQLVHQATTTQKDAQTLLANTDHLVLTGNEGATSVKGFYDDFAKTLANTRTQGVDTQKLYNFFANPILASDVTPKPDKKVVNQNTIDFRLLLLFFMGIISGCLLLLIGQLVVKKIAFSKMV